MLLIYVFVLRGVKNLTFIRIPHSTFADCRAKVLRVDGQNLDAKKIIKEPE